MNSTTIFQLKNLSFFETKLFEAFKSGKFSSKFLTLTEVHFAHQVLLKWLAKGIGFFILTEIICFVFLVKEIIILVEVILKVVRSKSMMRNVENFNLQKMDLKVSNSKLLKAHYASF